MLTCRVALLRVREQLVDFCSIMSLPSDEVGKLQQHLELLREQYVRLQHRHAELEQKYTRAVSATGNVGPDHFVSRLLSLVSDLYDKPLYR